MDSILLIIIKKSLKGIDKAKFKKAMSAMRDAFKAGICVSELVATASEREKLGSVMPVSSTQPRRFI